MSNQLQKRMNELKPYVIGIRFLEEMTVIDTLFTEGWSVPASRTIKVAKSEDNANYHMFYAEDDSVPLDSIMDFIAETIKINIEREKKFELLKVKVEELKIFFQTNPLSKLQNMKFVLGEVNILPEKLTEDILNTEFDLDITDTVPSVPVVEKPKAKPTTQPEVIGETDPDYDVQQFNNRFKHQDIELPPRKGEKIEVESFEPPVATGPCNHSPDTFCPNCIDEVDY